ncbi:MAG TPA: trigger factor [Polyangiaceae bacterium]|nr:trigger factor [Polyangiaceae bacterium]HOR35307.1 trigger factor [Polyangiaceae bacterium]
MSRTHNRRCACDGRPMMQVTVERLSPVLIEFHVTVPVERVKASMKRALDNLARSAHIKGFRKGKAPQEVLQHLFGERIAADVSNRLVEDTLNAALKDKNIRPISSPQIEKPKPNPSEDFAYTARFEVTPDIEKVDYEGLEVKRTAYPVSEAMIDREIEKLRLRYANLVVPEPARPAQKQDVVTFDFVLEVGGKQVQDGRGVDTTAEVGSANLLPELSEAFEGKEAGASFDVALTFPEAYQRQEFRGMKGVFHITLKEIKQRVLPELDDEFAKDVGSYDTLDALRQDVRQKIEKANAERAENEVAEALVVELCKRNPVPVPPSLVDQQARMQENEILERARTQGNNVQSVSPDMRQRIRMDAEIKVRAGLLMAEIAKAQKLQITDDDIQKAYVELAEQTGQNVNKIKVQYRDPKQREMLIGMILEDKVLTIIEQAAKIEQVTGPEAE